MRNAHFRSLGLLLMLASCQPSVAREPVRSPVPAPSERPAPASELAVGNSAIGYQKVMTATSMAGVVVGPAARPTALVFFASWCGPCRRELADLAEIRQAYPELRIIGVNSYEDFRDYSDAEKLRQFLADNAPWMTEVVHADAQMLADFGNVPRIPTLLVYDAGGKVTAEFRRNLRAPPSYQELDQAIAAAVAASR